MKEKELKKAVNAIKLPKEAKERILCRALNFAKNINRSVSITNSK